MGDTHQGVPVPARLVAQQALLRGARGARDAGADAKRKYISPKAAEAPRAVAGGATEVEPVFVVVARDPDLREPGWVCMGGSPAFQLRLLSS